jgi:hypothetical protein
MSEEQESQNVLRPRYEQYELYETALPPWKRGGGRPSRYNNLIKKFLESNMKTAMIKLDDKNKDKAYQGIRKAILDYHIRNVKVHRRSNEVYLTRIEAINNE